MGIFDQVSFRKPKKSQFDLSHEKKLSLNMGELIPTLVEEVVPGDVFKVKQNNLVRMHPLVAPIMHRIDVFTHYFYVPNRIVWKDWEKFIFMEDPNLIVPQYSIGTSHDVTNNILGVDDSNNKIGTLLDYLGFPTPLPQGVDFNVLPLLAYHKIYDDYYRDQDLESEISQDFFPTDGQVTKYFGSLFTLRKRSWKKDYFTSARPWAQKGGDVLLPISGEARYKDAKAINSGIGNSDDGNLSVSGGTVRDSGGNPVQIENIGELSIDAPNITELRRASRLQEWLEKNARAGTRYIESLFAHFGELSDDARLQRPEYLGGGKQPVQISEVANTSNTADAPQGNLSGEGTSMGSAGFSRKFKEHGYVIGITSIMPKPAYMQGIRRTYLRQEALDYLQPEFANIGEQPIFNAELYAQGNSQDMETFGYQSRYAEYKFSPDSAHGDFRATLEHWHLTRKFDSLPGLNKEFIHYNFGDDQKRIFPVMDDTDKFYMQIYNDIKAIRPLPYFSDPRL